MNKSKIFDKLVDMFLSTDELGHFNDKEYSIMLYGIENKREVIDDIKSRIDSVTNKYKLVVLDKEEKPNINILDIGL